MSVTQRNSKSYASILPRKFSSRLLFSVSPSSSCSSLLTAIHLPKTATDHEARTQPQMMPNTFDAARTRLLLPGRYDSSDFAPRCGSTLQVIVSDLCGERRCHIFPASATLECFKATLALSRGVNASCLVVVLRGAIIDEDHRGPQTLVSLGLRDGSTVHVFAREPIARPAAAPRRATSGHSVAAPPRCVPLSKARWHRASASWLSRGCLHSARPCLGLPQASVGKP